MSHCSIANVFDVRSYWNAELFFTIVLVLAFSLAYMCAICCGTTVTPVITCARLL